MCRFAEHFITLAAERLHSWIRNRYLIAGVIYGLSGKSLLSDRIAVKRFDRITDASFRQMFFMEKYIRLRGAFFSVLFLLFMAK